MASFSRTIMVWAWLSSLLLGCSTPLYSWGHYEQQIYVSYMTPGGMPTETQVAELEQDYQKARAENKRMPPGFHAQLGYMYFRLGRVDEARRELETEKTEFPESAVLVDRLLASLKKP